MNQCAIREINGHFVIVVIGPNGHEQELFHASTSDDAVEWVGWLRERQSGLSS